MIIAELNDQGLASAVFVAVGSAGSDQRRSSGLRELIRRTPHRVVSMLEVANPARHRRRDVFLDDLAGPAIR
jgi:hypothetical protein